MYDAELIYLGYLPRAGSGLHGAPSRMRSQDSMGMPGRCLCMMSAVCVARTIDDFISRTLGSTALPLTSC